MSRRRFDMENILSQPVENNDIISRNSSLSSQENKININDRSLEKYDSFPLHKKYSDDHMMEI